MLHRPPLAPAALLLPMLLGACQPGGNADIPGDSSDTRPFSGIGAAETLHFVGTEPFWGGEVTGTALRYSTPENQDGTAIMVKRFGGRGGLSFSDALEGAAFDMTVTPGRCSDGMSDRTFPFVVTLRLGEETRNGCGWTEAAPFEGPAAP